MKFTVNSQEKYQTNSTVHSFNKRSKYHLHILTGNHSNFQKSLHSSDIKKLKLIMQIYKYGKRKAQFMPASSKYFNTQSFYSVKEFITPKKPLIKLSALNNAFCIIF